MARRQSQTLTEGELRIMEVLWDKGRATVNDVAAALSSASLAYNTVLTMLRILERKGHVRHTKDGRAFVYQAVVERGEARRDAVRHLISRFFQNSPELLMLNLLRDERIDDTELKRLRKQVEGKP